MNSERRFKVIEIYLNEKIKNQRLNDILEKFKTNTKKLEITIKSSTRSCFNFRIVAPEVDELLLYLYTNSLDEIRSSSGQRLEFANFSKLRNLTINFLDEVQSVFTAISDDSLEKLTIFRSEINENVLQEFVSRQKKITKINLDPLGNINLDHLVLKELNIRKDFNNHASSFVSYQNRLNLLFENQSELRYLDINKVTEGPFTKICQLDKLESLRIEVNLEEMSCIENLSSLQNLIELELTDRSKSESEFWPGSIFLERVKLPKLQKLNLSTTDVIDPRIFTAMGRGMENLQKLCIGKGRISCLPRIIGSFQALKNLILAYLTPDAVTEDCVSTLCRQNKSLEKLSVYEVCGPKKSTYNVISACPNLKHLSLLFEDGVLNSDMIDFIKKLAFLESVDATSMQITFNDVHVTDHLHPLLTAIITHFRESKCLTKLYINRVPAFRKQSLENAFGKDIDKVVFDSNAEVQNSLGISKKK